MDAASALAILATAAALLTAVFGALRFNREDAKQAVETMRSLNAELQEAYKRMRDERDDAERRCQECLLRKARLEQRLREAGETP